MTAGPTVSREQIVGFRRSVGMLDERAPLAASALRRAAWAGLQDSMPRAALLSIHARVSDTTPTTWERPPLAQVWGPRFSAFVVSESDRGVFTVGRHPDGAGAKRADDTADRLATLLGDGRMTYSDAGRALGVDPNALRYAATTGRVMLRWEGTGKPEIWMAPAPATSVDDARRELARRYFHVFGPGDAASFAQWAGIRPPRAVRIVESLANELVAVSTPVGERFVLASDMPSFESRAGLPSGVRLLPSGDAFYLLWGPDRELLVPDTRRRPLLWTSRVWPGALLVGGEIAGTWSRTGRSVRVAPWRRLSRPERNDVVTEAEALPLPGVEGTIDVRFET